jgi:hypothetical protein
MDISVSRQKRTKILWDMSDLCSSITTNTCLKHGEEQVPVVAVDLVSFPGDVPHSTIVNSGEVYLLGPFDEHFLPIAMIHMHHVKPNRFILQRKLDDAVDGDGTTLESSNSTNTTEGCIPPDVLGAFHESFVNPNIVEFDDVPDGTKVYEYQRTVVIDGVEVMGFYVDF